MRKGIKEKDIRDFEKYVRKLSEVIGHIVQYQPSARIYVTPGEINLMSDWPEDVPESAEELCVSSVECYRMDCGDW